MDFSKIDGYEFEEIIGNLFKNMGFDVEQTVLTGDGGVDIIAYYTRPIFRGRYIIQCKNWINSVGQPPIRDLYGVVMSERANKGILITTSTFTEKAREFADNKNIELIDKDILIKLLNQYNSKDTTITKCENRTVKFYDFNNFNKSNYLFLKEKITSNRNDKMYYDNLRKFYHEYIISNEYEICVNGLIDEYIELNNEIIKRFCKRSKEKLANARMLKYLNGYLFILKGELFKAIDIFNDLGILDPSDDIQFSIESYCRKSLLTIENAEDVVWNGDFYGCISKCKSKSINVIIKNLYLLFVHLKYQNGINYLEEIIPKYYELEKDKIKKLMMSPFSVVDNKRIELIIDNNTKEFNNIKSKKNKKFHIPIDISIKKIYSGEFSIYADYDDDVFISIDEIMNNYLSRCDIEKELRKIDVIISNKY